MESKVIVIHHGSHSLKIGLASDSVPKTIPNYIARKRKENITTPTTISSTTETTKSPIDSSNNEKDLHNNIKTSNENNDDSMKIDEKTVTPSESITPTTTTEDVKPTSAEATITTITTTEEEAKPSSMDIDKPSITHSSDKKEIETKTDTIITTETNSTSITPTPIPILTDIKIETQQPISQISKTQTKIHLPRKLLEEVEQSVKETTKLLPPVDYIKVRQKPTLYNENNATTFEIIKKKKKKTTTSSLSSLTNVVTTPPPYAPQPLNYKEIDYCIGDDAITVSRDKDEWIAYQPITMSTFNTGIYNSAQSLFDDLTQMWKYAIQRYLNIPSSDLSSYGCVYVVTDNIDKKSLKQITTLLLTELQFTSVLFFQESICSSFGVSMATQSCVIDLGHQKISIACVDEGYLLPNTRLTLGYGGEQLTKLLEYLLTGMDKCDLDSTISSRQMASKQIHKYYFPFKSSINELVDFSPFYLNVFDNIKIENLDYNYNDFQKQRVGTFKVKDIKQEKHMNIYHFNADEVYQVVGMSLFYPSVLAHFGGSSVNYLVKSRPLVNGGGGGESNSIYVEDQKHYYNHYLSSYDHEDPFDGHNHSHMHSFGQNSTSRDSKEGSGNITVSPSASNSTAPSTSTASSPTKKKTGSSPNSYEDYIDIPLDIAILKSVSQLERSDVNKKKYLSNILLVGGGALTPGIQDVLKVCIFKQLEQQYQAQQLQIQQQQQQQQQQQLQSSTNSATTTPTPSSATIIPLENYIGFANSGIRSDVDYRHAGWRGGAILGCLESTREIWITRSEWQDGKKSSALNKLPF
ncbi:hypothetical protein RB653_008248 [Dictyostelium firmibasis]|uniref:Actin-related protein 8 n=1 Tax=Dictyostelium firmibasis TaxID=79012 RepID=A0AAN7TZP1_9MYCE